MLRNNCEDGGGESHVKEAVVLGTTLLKLLQVLLELVEGLILVVLTGNVSAKAGKIGKLLLDLLGRSLDVRLYAAQELFVVHLGAGIPDDFDIIGQKAISELMEGRHVSNGCSASLCYGIEA